jgi:hypothetical protein
LIAADGTAGPAFKPTSRPGHAFAPAVAFSGTNYLCVSRFQGDGRAELLGQRITPNGALLDGDEGFLLPGSGSTADAPAVASDGQGWMVVRTEYRVDGFRMTHIDSDGSVLENAVLSAPWSLEAASPVVAYGNGVYLVAWAEAAIAIRGVRLASDGTPLDEQPIGVSTYPSPKMMGGIAWDGSRFLVTWSDARLSDEWGEPIYDIYAARVAPDGSVLDENGIEVNAFPRYSKKNSSVAALSDGFVVAWSIQPKDISDPKGIHTARLTGDGALIDGPATSEGYDAVIEKGGVLDNCLIGPAGDGRTSVLWSIGAVYEAVFAW